MQRECRFCGSLNLEVIFRASVDNKLKAGKNSFFPTASDFGIFYDLAKCKECNVVFVLLDEAAQYSERSYAEAKDNLYLCQAEERGKTFQRILTHLKKFIPQNCRLLDTGCSYGIFLKLISRSGIEAYGVEVNKEACRYAREILGLNVFFGDLKEIDFADGYFDIITAIELIEHLSDIRGFINKVRKLLRKGGILYLVTPDIESFSARLLGYRWWSYRKMHLNYFSRVTLYRFLEKNGFSVISSRPLRKTFKTKYILDNLCELEGRKLFFNCLYFLSRVFRLENLLISSSFGDIAVTAKKL